MDSIPSIDSRWIFVATNEQIQLAAEAASWLPDAGKFAAFFDFPSLDFPYTGSTDFGIDGYVARAMGDRTATTINNAVVSIQPDLVVLLGLNENSASYLRTRFPGDMIVEVSSIQEFVAALKLLPPSGGEVACRPGELMRGLALARLEQKRLIVDEKAAPLSASLRVGGEGLVAVEEEREVSEIVAVNFALSAKLDLLFIPAIEQDKLRNLPSDLHHWSSDPSHHIFQEWARHVRNALRGVDLGAYEHATFFTTGLPYGLFVQNTVRCCHVQKYRDTSEAAVSAISEEHSPTVFRSALLFSPELFASEETKEIAAIFERHAFRTKMLLGKEANVKNLSNFGSSYPYDLLHICSHGGQTNGYFTIRSFKDREGKMHTAEYYEVVGFAPAEGDLVQVVSKQIFHKLDGHRWRSEPLGAYPQYVFEDMLQSMKSEESVIRTPYSSKIALSCHIQCYGSIHQGDFHQLAGFGNPVVFNNTCASSHELEVSFLHAGARAYIGTLWNVGNEVAKKAALTFYRSLESDPNLSRAVHRMLQGIPVKKYRNIYVYWGFPFSTFRVANNTAVDSVLPGLMFVWRLWVRKASTTLDAEVKKNCLPIIRFVTEQIVSELDARDIKGFEEFEPETAAEIERSLPAQERSTIFENDELVLEG